MSGGRRGDGTAADGGFTLVELLVVMVIIGTLAAIAVPAYLTVRQRAATTSLKADVTTIGKQLAAYYLENANAIVVDTTSRPGYAGIQGAGLPYERLSPNTHASYPTFTSTAGQVASTWCVALANSDASPQTFRYSAANGLEPGKCS